MLNFILMASVLLFLLAPLIAMCIYGYTHEGGWRPMLFGAGWMLLNTILLYLLIPMLLGSQKWFLSIVENTPLWAFIFTLMQCLLLFGACALTFHNVHKKENTTDDGVPHISSEQFALVFGLSYGVMNGAIYCGFPALNALLSNVSQDAALNAMGMSEILAESLCMIGIYAAIAYYLEKYMRSNARSRIVLLFLMVYILFLAGNIWGVLLQFPSQSRLILLAAIFVVCAWLLKQPFLSLFHVPDGTSV